MPPYFAYIECLIAYLALMAAALAACALLFLMPSKRRLAVRLCLAVLASLPGVLAFQFVAGIPLLLLLAAVWGLYAVFHSPDWAQWAVGLPTIAIMFILLAGASLLGCYTGGRIGWQIGGGTPFRTAIVEQKIVRFVFSFFRRGAA